MFRLRITGDLGFEFWQDIPEWEGLYQVSTYGNVRSLDRMQPFKNRWGFICDKRIKGQDIKPIEDKCGYLTVNLKDKEKNKVLKIHRLVGITFLPKWETGYDQINHKNEIKSDNKVENLEWCDTKYNANYGTAIQRRIEKTVKPIIQYTKTGQFVREWKSMAECARQNGYTIAGICNCCTGLRKYYNGYIWKYKKDA